MNNEYEVIRLRSGRDARGTGGRVLRNMTEYDVIFRLRSGRDARGTGGRVLRNMTEYDVIFRLRRSRGTPEDHGEGYNRDGI
jgi:hypothetical protein